MYQIIDNIRLTRKHRVCHVLNETGGLMWTGKCAGEAIQWLYENDHNEASLKIGEAEYELSISLYPI